jgi:transcriptional regulator with XRE-family HTH domain
MPATPVPKLNVRPLEAHRMLGRQLRRLRERREWTVAMAAARFGGSASKLSRLESGETMVKEGDLFHLLDLYAVTDHYQRDALWRLARALTDRHWWHGDRDVLGGWFCSYLTLEAISQAIRTYEVRFIPGLLQTEEYAEAVIRRRFQDPAEIRRRVTTRMRRQQTILDARTAVWAIVDFAALSEPFAGAQVMRRQIVYLRDVAARENVTVQILPPGAGGIAGIGNSFSLLRLRGEALPDVVSRTHRRRSVLRRRSPVRPVSVRDGRTRLHRVQPEDTKTVLSGALTLLESRT